MMLNMLFFTISIKRIPMTAEEYMHQEKIKRLREELQAKAMMNRPFL
ncbi:YrzI family small protein [Bacillus massiliglaciei]|nr:YrzI family small protein [Bacillus massiliglaciei]